MKVGSTLRRVEHNYLSAMSLYILGVRHDFVCGHLYWSCLSHSCPYEWTQAVGPKKISKLLTAQWTHKAKFVHAHFGLWTSHFPWVSVVWGWIISMYFLQLSFKKSVELLVTILIDNSFILSCSIYRGTNIYI